mmetsp:Transcript_8718/g.22454  ORF Transcript_8718/g.22454 Transcript_8718/m.22454 type:complete len:341 (+) Transcript_8718:138-1160(+)
MAVCHPRESAQRDEDRHADASRDHHHVREREAQGPLLLVLASQRHPLADYGYAMVGHVNEATAGLDECADREGSCGRVVDGHHVPGPLYLDPREAAGALVAAGRNAADAQVLQRRGDELLRARPLDRGGHREATDVVAGGVLHAVVEGDSDAPLQGSADRAGVAELIILVELRQDNAARGAVAEGLGTGGAAHIERTHHVLAHVPGRKRLVVVGRAAAAVLLREAVVVVVGLVAQVRLHQLPGPPFGRQRVVAGDQALPPSKLREAAALDGLVDDAVADGHPDQADGVERPDVVVHDCRGPRRHVVASVGLRRKDYVAVGMLREEQPPATEERHHVTAGL